MKNTKFLKAVCKKTGRHFALELAQIGGTWKAVNFLEIDGKQAALMTSEVRQPRFVTNENLRPCVKCGNREVGGCKCAPGRYDCARDRSYHFQCVYCRQLSVDYSAPAASAGYRDGDVIRLEQGQEVRIRFNDRPITEIFVGVGWDPVRIGRDMDVDSSVIVAGNGGREIVYFSQLKHSSGCVVHHGDNLTGEDGGGNDDDENISVFLDKVPANRDRLIFVLNIFECKERRQTLGNVKNMYIRLYDPVSHRALIEYKVLDNLKNDTALIIGVAQRRGQEWHFKAIGRGSRAGNVHELADEAVALF